jgi:hypothetical protein
MIKLKNILNEKFEMGDSDKRKLKASIKAFNASKTKFHFVKEMAKVLKRNKLPGTAKELTDALETLMKAVENVEAQHMNESSINIRGNVKWSNPEARKFSEESVNKAAKIIGKAQGAAVSIFTSDLKNNRYDNMDLSKAINSGNIRDASYSKREVLSKLYYDVRDRFMKLGRRKKN